MISAQIYLLSESETPCIWGATNFLIDYIVITRSYLMIGVVSIIRMIVGRWAELSKPLVILEESVAS